MGTSIGKPRVVDTIVSQSDGSKASLAEVGLMAPSHERGFQKSLLLEVVHLHTQGGVSDGGLVPLREVVVYYCST